MALLVRPTRLLRSAIVLKPSTLLGLDKALSKQKYRKLFAPNRRRKPGPKGPSAELIRAVVEMKQRNPNWGCPRIAQQIALAFQIQIDRDMVRRILAQRYRPGQDSGGPSWLTFLATQKTVSGASIPSGAGQPPGAGGDRNQDGALCAFIPSVCRAGPYAENAWTARYSGPPPTWRPSYSISSIVIMSIERTPDAKGTRR
jgi:hypothetical protein